MGRRKTCWVCGKPVTFRVSFKLTPEGDSPVSHGMSADADCCDEHAQRALEGMEEKAAYFRRWIATGEMDEVRQERSKAAREALPHCAFCPESEETRLAQHDLGPWYCPQCGRTQVNPGDT